MAVVAEIVLAVALTVLLVGATDSTGDAVPRPIVLLMLFGTPGIVGALGAIGRRRSLLFAPGAALLPGSMLSFAGVTLIFVLPAALFWAAAVSMASAPGRRVLEFAEVTVLFGLLVGAAIAMFAMTTQGCFATPGGETCGTGFLSASGVAFATAAELLAVAFAAWRAGVLRRVEDRAAV